MARSARLQCGQATLTVIGVCLIGNNSVPEQAGQCAALIGSAMAGRVVGDFHQQENSFAFVDGVV